MRFLFRSNDKKGLPANFYKKIPNEITFAMPISEHAKLIYEIYAIPYKGANGSQQKRIVHGISHVSRVAYYVPIMASLFFRYDNALSIPADDLKLLQIAALFHDAGREGEEEDIWDLDSAKLLYAYLVEILKLDPNKAIEFAEIIANKDYIKGSVYHFLRLTENTNDPTWIKEKQTSRDKTLFQQLLHDADCLDIIRARDKFDAKYLDFYQNYVKPTEERHDKQYLISQQMHEMGQLICEARSLIEHCGDTRRSWSSEKQDSYNTAESYELIVTTISNNKQDFPVMSAWFNYEKMQQSNHSLAGGGEQELPPPLQTLNYPQIDNDILVFRGVLAPSAKSGGDHAIDFYGNQKSTAKVEMRMMHQRQQIDLNAKEDGNKNRSVSMIGHLMETLSSKETLSHVQSNNIDEFEKKFIGHGSGVYANAGFGIRASIHDLSRVYRDGDADTGRSSKQQTNDDEIMIKKDLFCLFKNLQLGGIHYKDRCFLHTELLMNVRNVHGVIFSNDPTMGADNINFKSQRRLPHGVAMLEALYLHDYYCIHVAQLPRTDVYETMVDNSDLPIYEYSGLHNTFRKIAYPSREEILAIWDNLTLSFFKEYPDAIRTFNLGSVEDHNDASLKSLICYRQNKFLIHGEVFEFSGLDHFYPPALRHELNQRLKRALVDGFRVQVIQSQYFLEYHLKLLSQYLQVKLEDSSTLAPFLRKSADLVMRKNKLDEVSAVFAAFTIFNEYNLLSIGRLTSTSVHSKSSQFQLHPSIKNVFFSREGIIIQHPNDTVSSEVLQYQLTTVDAELFTALMYIQQLEGKINKDIYVKWENAIHHSVNDQQPNKPETLLKAFYILLVIHLTSFDENQKNKLILSEDFLSVFQSIKQQKLLILHMHDKELTALQHAISFGLLPILEERSLYIEDIVGLGNLLDSLKTATQYTSYIHQVLNVLPKHFWEKTRHDATDETPFMFLCKKIKSNPKNQNLMTVAHIVINNVSPLAFLSAMDNGETPLLNLCWALELNPKDPILNATVQLAIQKAPPDTLTKALMNQVPFSGDTTLIALTRALLSNPTQHTLIATVKLAVEKAPEDAFCVALTGHPFFRGVGGDKALRQLCEAQRLNPRETVLIDTVKLAVKKAPELVLSKALGLVFESLPLNPTDSTLISALRLATKNDPALICCRTPC